MSRSSDKELSVGIPRPPGEFKGQNVNFCKSIRY